MEYGRLGAYFPKGIYGRTAIILVLPVLFVVLVASAVFVQRHHDRVTRKMVANVVPQIQFVRSAIEREESRADAIETASSVARALGMAVHPAATPDSPIHASLAFYDFSGRVIVDSLLSGLPGITTPIIDYDNKPYSVNFVVETRHGAIAFKLPRGNLAAANPHQFIVLLVAIAIITTGIATYFIRSQLRPVRSLARAAEAFGKGQKVNYSPSGARELQNAGHAFLEMRDRIERHIENRTLMLSGISHDLKTPLTRMKLGLGLMEPSEDAEDLVGDVDSMTIMIDEFLDYARTDETESAVATDPIALARSVIDEQRFEGTFVQLEVDANDANGAFRVHLKPTALRRALQNLLDNARKYAGQIVLTVKIMESAIVFTVDDDGPGIPEELREKAMQPFSRLDESRSLNRRGGAGLGLAIVRDAASSHGGSLQLGYSPALGGLRATIRLPY